MGHARHAKPLGLCDDRLAYCHQLVDYRCRGSASECNGSRHHGTICRTILSSSLAACLECMRETHCHVLGNAMPRLRVCGRHVLHHSAARLRAQRENMHYPGNHAVPSSKLPCGNTSSSQPMLLITPTCSNPIFKNSSVEACSATLQPCSHVLFESPAGCPTFLVGLPSSQALPEASATENCDLTYKARAIPLVQPGKKPPLPWGRN